MKLEGVPSVRLHARRDFTSRGSNFFIRWTEVFFLAHSSDLEPSDHMTTASCLAKAISVTLSPFLEKLIKAGMGIVAIRVNLDVEKVSAPSLAKFLFDLSVIFTTGILRRRGGREATPFANDESPRRHSDTADTLRGRQSQVMPGALISNLELLRILIFRYIHAGSARAFVMITISSKLTRILSGLAVTAGTHYIFY